MRCDQVIRELAVPTDDRDATALTSHIAGCAACADWANRAVKLDRLWRATRPSDPTAEVWDTVWTKLASSLDPTISKQLAPITSQTGSSTESPMTGGIPRYKKRRPPSDWRVWSFVAIGLAQAAAIFLAVGLTGQSFGPPKSPRILRPDLAMPSSLSSKSAVQIAVPEEGFPVVIDEGRLVVIHEGRQTRQIPMPVFLADLSMFVIHAGGQAPRIMDRTPEGGVFGVDDCVMYNAMESMANPVVAMKE